MDLPDAALERSCTSRKRVSNRINDGLTAGRVRASHRHALSTGPWKRTKNSWQTETINSQSDQSYSLLSMVFRGSALSQEPIESWGRRQRRADGTPTCPVAAPRFEPGALARLGRTILLAPFLAPLRSSESKRTCMLSLTSVTS